MAVALTANVTGSDVAAVLGRGSDDAFVSGLGQIAADLARDAASSHCRGVGFDDLDQIPVSLRSVILLRAVRIASNYLQLQAEDRDGVSMSYGQGGQGFLLQELISLDEHRRKTASVKPECPTTPTP